MKVENILQVLNVAILQNELMLKLFLQYNIKGLILNNTVKTFQSQITVNSKLKIYLVNSHY